MPNRTQLLGKIRPRIGLITSLETLRHQRQERSPLIVPEGEGTVEVKMAKRSQVLTLLQLRRRSKKLMKRLLLPRLMEASGGGIVAISAR